MRATDAGVLIIVLLLTWSFYKEHKNPDSKFNLLELLMDKGRMSKMAFAFMTTLGVTSWIMVRLTVEGKLTEGYFTAFGLMWVAPLTAKLFSTVRPQEVQDVRVP